MVLPIVGELLVYTEGKEGITYPLEFPAAYVAFPINYLLYQKYLLHNVLKYI